MILCMAAGGQGREWCRDNLCTVGKRLALLVPKALMKLPPGEIGNKGIPQVL